MPDSRTITPKWGTSETLPLPKQYNTSIRELTASRTSVEGFDWKSDVFTADLFSADDAKAIEREVLDTGYRFEFSATASLDSEPEKYRRPDAGDKNFVADEGGHLEIRIDAASLLRFGGHVTGTLTSSRPPASRAASTAASIPSCNPATSPSRSSTMIARSSSMPMRGTNAYVRSSHLPCSR